MVMGSGSVPDPTGDADRMLEDLLGLADSPTEATRSGATRVPDIASARPAEPDAAPGDPAADALQVGVDLLGRAEIDVDGTALTVDKMAGYDWSEPPHQPHDVAVRLSHNEQFPGHWTAQVEWPERLGDGETVYRVIVADGQPVESDCDDADMTLAVRQEPNAVDDTYINRPFAPVRFYEVWAYAGPSVADAVTRSPYLFATGRVVWPPMMLEAFPDDGQIIGRWQPLPSSQYRWLRQGRREARSVRPTPDEATPVAEAGFVDNDAEPGTPYRYVVFAGAVVDGSVQWCDTPATIKTELAVTLQPVLDLQVQHDPARPELVAISWTPPAAGNVEIYRSTTAPSAEIHRTGEVSEEGLSAPELGLAEAVLVPNPTSLDAQTGRAVKRDVALPAGEAEFYFTPVTGAPRGPGRVPGKPVILLRPVAPGSPYLEDRVDWVLIAFEWPRGASTVRLYVTGPGGVVDPVNSQPLETIVEAEARSFGGFQIPRDRLAVGPQTLHLVAHKQHAGTEAFSDVVTVEHTFPILVRYSLEWQTGRFRGARGTVRLHSDHPIAGLGLALMWSDVGLPLTRADGAQLALWAQNIVPGADAANVIDIKGCLGDRPLPTTGWLRLLSDPGKNVALLDPPAGQLNLTGRGSK